MSLSVLWFILIAVLFIVYFFLEGFDFGIGMLLPMMGKTDLDRRLMINSIGPTWDASEVWLITAGGAMFAVFPGWYATMFSGFYLPLFLVLVALIARGVAFEFRNKIQAEAWKRVWDACLFFGSLLPPLILGVAFANLIMGVPIDANKQFTGSFLGLLSLPALIAGLTVVSVFIYHGAVFLSLKMNETLTERALQQAKRWGPVSIVFAAAAVILGALNTDAFSKPASLSAAIASVLALVLSYVLVLRKKSGGSILLNGIAIICAFASLFTGLFPRVMVSSLNPGYSLTIYTVSSSPYTLQVITVIALCLLPIVLAYSVWTWWVMRKRLQEKDLEY